LAGAAGFAAGFGAAFLAAFLRPVARFAALRPAVRFFAAALRATVLRAAPLRAPARFLAVDFRLAFLPPMAAFARFIAAVAARFIFFKAVVAPELLLRFLDFAMVFLLVASPHTMDQTIAQQNT
jgi:hypothetical protein